MVKWNINEIMLKISTKFVTLFESLEDTSPLRYGQNRISDACKEVNKRIASRKQQTDGAQKHQRDFRKLHSDLQSRIWGFLSRLGDELNLAATTAAPPPECHSRDATRRQGSWERSPLDSAGGILPESRGCFLKWVSVEINGLFVEVDKVDKLHTETL